MLRLYLSLALLSCLSVTCGAMTCKQTINNVTYDLSPLSGHDSNVIPSFGNYNYYINVCGAVQASECSSRGSAFVCQVRKSPVDQFESVVAYDDDTHLPLLVWAPSSAPNGGVTLTTTNGDSCNLRNRTAIIDFQCDPSGNQTAAISVTESPQCTFNVVYITKYACPQVHSSSSSSSSTAIHSSSSSSSTGMNSSSSSSTGMDSSSSSSSEHSSSTGVDSSSSSSSSEHSSSTGMDSSSSSSRTSSTAMESSSSSSSAVHSSTSMASSTGDSSSSTGPSPLPATVAASDDTEKWPHIAMGFGAGVGITVVLMFCGWYLRGRWSQRDNNDTHDAAFTRMNA